MKINKQKVFSTILPLIFVSPLWANTSAVDCNDISKKFAGLVDDVYAPNAQIFTDKDKSIGATWMYWDRLEQAFHASDSKKLKELFTGPNRITRNDISNISHQLNSGNWKALGLTLSQIQKR